MQWDKANINPISQVRAQNTGGRSWLPQGSEQEALGAGWGPHRMADKALGFLWAEILPSLKIYCENFKHTCIGVFKTINSS